MGDSLASDDDKYRMTTGELRKALADESHPRHVEAVQLNADLAKNLGPALEQLSRVVGGLVTEQSGVKKVVSGMAEAVAAAIPTPRIPQSVEPVSPAIHGWNELTDQPSLEEAMHEAIEGRERRQEMQDDLARQTLEVLQSIAATLDQLKEMTS